MKNKIRLSLAIIAVSASFIFAQKQFSRRNTNPFPTSTKTVTTTSTALNGLYVDNFNLIGGVTVKEDSLLTYCRTNGVNWLYLYDLNSFMADDPGKTKLAAFLTKFHAAGIKSAGVYVSQSSLTKRISYNDSRTKSAEKLDGLNLELEYWNNPGTFAEWENLILNARAYTSAKGLKSDFYIGFLKNAGVDAPTQAKFMVTATDRASLHCYIDSTRMASTDGAFTYLQARLNELGLQALDKGKVYTVEIIFAKSYKIDANTTIVNGWFNTHTVSEALQKVKTSAAKLSWTGKNGIKIEGAIRYNYTQFK